jgi:hypothetical protein
MMNQVEEVGRREKFDRINKMDMIPLSLNAIYDRFLLQKKTEA